MRLFFLQSRSFKVNSIENKLHFEAQQAQLFEFTVTHRWSISSASAAKPKSKAYFHYYYEAVVHSSALSFLFLKHCQFLPFFCSFRFCQINFHIKIVHLAHGRIISFFCKSFKVFHHFCLNVFEPVCSDVIGYRKKRIWHSWREEIYVLISQQPLSAANETSLFYFLLLNFHLLLSCHWIRFDEKPSQIKNFFNEKIWKDNNGFLHHENHLMSVSFTNENLHYATSVTTKYKSFWWIDTQTEPIHLINQSQLSEKWVVCKAKQKISS